jgi:hypothetical protein
LGGRGEQTPWPVMAELSISVLVMGEEDDVRVGLTVQVNRPIHLA